MSLPQPPWITTEPIIFSKEMEEMYKELIRRYLRATTRDGRRRMSYQFVEEECARSNLNAFERRYGLTLTQRIHHKGVGGRH